jgi:hypothetical protein
MPRRSKYDFEAMRASLNVECLRCHAALSPAEYMRLDWEQLRCTKLGKDFEAPQRPGVPMRTN